MTSNSDDDFWVSSNKKQLELTLTHYLGAFDSTVETLDEVVSKVKQERENSENIQKKTNSDNFNEDIEESFYDTTGSEEKVKLQAEIQRLQFLRKQQEFLTEQECQSYTNLIKTADENMLTNVLNTIRLSKENNKKTELFNKTTLERDPSVVFYEKNINENEDVNNELFSNTDGSILHELINEDDYKDNDTMEKEDLRKQLNELKNKNKELIDIVNVLKKILESKEKEIDQFKLLLSHITNGSTIEI